MTYTDHSYRTLPRIANSDLSELERIATGKPPFSVSQAALDFGTAFHTLILEPVTPDEQVLTPDDCPLLTGPATL